VGVGGFWAALRCADSSTAFRGECFAGAADKELLSCTPPVPQDKQLQTEAVVSGGKGLTMVTVCKSRR